MLLEFIQTSYRDNFCFYQVISKFLSELPVLKIDVRLLE